MSAESEARLVPWGNMWIQPGLEFLWINQGKTRAALGHHADCYFLPGLRLGTDRRNAARNEAKMGRTRFIRSTLKNHLRQSLTLRMSDAKRHTLNPNLLRNFRRFTRY